MPGNRRPLHPRGRPGRLAVRRLLAVITLAVLLTAAVSAEVLIDEEISTFSDTSSDGWVNNTFGQTQSYDLANYLWFDNIQNYDELSYIVIDNMNYLTAPNLPEGRSEFTYNLTVKIAPG